MRYVTTTITATTSAAIDARNSPPTARPIPASAAAYRPITTVPAIGVTGSLPAARAPEPDPEGDDRRHHHDREVDPDPAPDRPAPPRQRRGEDQLEPARGLVGGPAGDERRGREPDDDEPELDEDELEEAPGRREVDVREHLRQDVHDVGRLERANRQATGSRCR